MSRARPAHRGRDAEIGVFSCQGTIAGPVSPARLGPVYSTLLRAVKQKREGFCPRAKMHDNEFGNQRIVERIRSILNPLLFTAAPGPGSTESPMPAEATEQAPRIPKDIGCAVPIQWPHLSQCFSGSESRVSAQPT